MHTPCGFQLTETDYQTFGGRRPKSPDQLTVRGPQTIDPPVGAAKQHCIVMNCGRRIDTPVGGESPRTRAVAGVYRVNRMGVLLGNIEAFARDHRRGKFAFEINLPLLGDFRRDIARRPAAAPRVMTIGGPVF